MTILEIFKLSSYTQWLGSFMIGFFAFFYFKTRPKEVTILGIYGVLSFVFQAVQTGCRYFLADYYKNINNVIGNLFVLFELGIFLYLYYIVLNRKSMRVTIATLLSLYVLFFLLTTTHQISSIDSATQTIRDLIMIICAVMYFFHLMYDLPESSLSKSPMFWINSGILFFFSCTFILSLSINHILNVLRDDFVLFWAFRNFLRAIFCIIICLGIWQARKRSKHITV